MKSKKIVHILFCISIVLMLICSCFANLVNTSGGNVKITDIRYVTEDGATLRALLYVPKSATIQNPAPAVISCHGYTSTAEMQAINAIELSRRGIVVMAIDMCCGHGLSTFPDERINKGIAPDVGTYSALQYLRRLPYVDINRVGMVGHSMGGTAIQYGADRAFINKEKDPNVVVPIALLPTAQAFSVNKEVTELIYAKFPVNLGVVFGQFDEFANSMWGVDKGSEINISKKAKAGMGFSGAEYNAYYRFGNNTKLDRNGALAAASEKNLRIIYQPPIIHSKIHFSKLAAADVIDFFDITLLDGKNPIPTSNQIWFWKEILTGIAFIGFFLFIATFGLLLLDVPYFKTIVKPEPASPTVLTNSNGKLVYLIMFIVGLLPAPLVYNWAMGRPFVIKPMGITSPMVFPPNSVFPMPVVNGLVVFNLICGTAALALFLGTYYLYLKKQDITADSLGYKLPGVQIAKSFLLAITIFIGAYLMLEIVNYFFMSDFRFFLFSVKTLTPKRFGMLIKYLPFFAYFFIISSLTLNSSVRIKGAKEWQNIVLMIISICGGLSVLHALDYISLYTTGVKMFPDNTYALAGILLWNLLFILPISAVYARLFYKKSGSIWLGGFINALVVTFFAISNTVVSAGTL